MRYLPLGVACRGALPAAASVYIAAPARVRSGLTSCPVAGVDRPILRTESPPCFTELGATKANERRGNAVPRLEFTSPLDRGLER